MRRCSPKWLLLVVAMATLAAGCTRKFFRERTDADVCALLTEKNKFEPWKIEQFHVYPDPRARFADPSDPDHPSMPPDDPAARHLSPNPQKPGKAGIARFDGTGYLELLAAWDSMNRANAEVLPPPDPVPETKIAVQDPNGDKSSSGYLITLEQACELGLINARDFQDQRENLYLSALPVSLQRFSFAAQFFALGNVDRLSAGAQTATGRRERWASNITEGVRKQFPTGALLLFQFANRLTMEMISGQKDASVSNTTLELTQPLLRDGGKAVTLEPLTQAERNMLYQIRNYARFRKSFFVSLAGGGSVQTDLVSGLGLSVGSVSANAGYLPTVLRAGQLDIERRNYRTLQELLVRFEAFAEGGAVSQLQVDQVKQRLLDSRNRINNAELNYRNTLDNFKLQLGLPPTLPLEVETSALRPLTQQLDRYQQILDQYSLFQVEASRDVGEAAKLRARYRALLTESHLVSGTTFRERILGRWGLWEKRTVEELEKQVLALREQLRQALDEKAKLQTAQKVVPDELDERIDQINREINLADLERQVRAFELQPWLKLADPAIRERNRRNLLRQAARSLELVIVEARNERFQALRQSWPTLPRVCLAGTDLVNSPLEDAYSKSAQYALTNRLDLMNERAQTVDSWRQIAVQANSLLGVLDVQYHLDSATPAGGLAPFGFAGSRTNHRLTFDWELPLVRRLERNNYRTALIAYQRQRRTLQATEDNILNSVRRDLRELRVLAENFRIQQEQVALAYFQFESALETFSEPVAAGGVITPERQASLSDQLLRAQQTLNGAQTGLYNVWINYLSLRMRLYLNLELLPLDARGVWIDEHTTYECPPAFQPADAAAGAKPVVHEPIPQPASDGEIQWRATTVNRKKES